MYLRKERNLSGKVIQRANLHEVNDWLAIPVYNKEGKHIFDKFRKGPWMDSSLPKYRYQTGSQASLYNIHLLTKEVRKVYITEGELDSLALETCKLVSVSSTGGSQTWRDEWTKEMEGKHVIVLYDTKNCATTAGQNFYRLL